MQCFKVGIQKLTVGERAIFTFQNLVSNCFPIFQMFCPYIIAIELYPDVRFSFCFIIVHLKTIVALKRSSK